ncbi:MAG: hypothetical protein NUW23_09615 [Firmicutes bacterium]|nr:hypothetical protein [Bacillota bacterium]
MAINKGNAAIGSILVAAGVLILIGQRMNIDFARILWPFFVIVPGAILFVTGLVAGKSGRWLSIFGSMGGVTGLLLLYQNSTGYWESWAYAWALVVPGAVGFGQLVHAAFSGDRDAAKLGANLGLAGAIIFLAGAVFFELIVGISGFGRFGLGRYLFPVGLIVLGVLWALSGLLSGRRESPAAPTTPTTPVEPGAPRQAEPVAQVAPEETPASSEPSAQGTPPEQPEQAEPTGEPERQEEDSAHPKADRDHRG